MGNLNNTSDAKEVIDFTPSQREIIRLAALGFPADEIASVLEIEKRTVEYTLNSEVAKAYADKLALRRHVAMARYQQELSDLIPFSLSFFKEVLTDPEADKGLKLRVAKEVLDRSGEGNMHRKSRLEVQSTKSMRVMDNDALLELKEQAARLGRSSSAIDVTPVVIESEVGDATKAEVTADDF